ncbi:MAG: peptidoglycan-binding protein [Okeania sp. SIO1H6]|nr:peptidoglycan-binding protein [Okeania sp. SIO1H6]
MHIEDFKDSADLKFGLEGIASDYILTEEIHEVLIAASYLDGPIEKKFDILSAQAFLRFQRDYKADLGEEQEFEYLSVETASKLIELRAEAVESFKDAVIPGNDPAGKIYQYMKKKNYRFFTGPQEYNIVYLEGINEDFSENPDRPNYFNDLRVVLEVQGGIPVVVGKWEATTEPGYHYTDYPMNRKGAARIAFDQYRAWQVDIHGTSEPHEALVQIGGEVTVHRDFDKNMIRTGDRLDTGYFGINQHYGYDHPRNDIYTASAGCLVGRTRRGHREFMSIIKQDRRYRNNRNYVFYSTVIAGDDWKQTT